MNLPILELPLPWLADASLRLALIVAAFLLARPLLRRFIGSAWVGVLWLVLLTRLLAPWPLETPFGLQSRASTAARVVASASVAAPALEEKPAGFEVRTRVIAEASSPVPGMTRDARRLGWREFWLVGVALGVVALGIRTVRTARLARRTEQARDPRLCAVFDEIPETWRRGVELRESDSISVPTLAGLVRPQIWMPRAWLFRLSDVELRHVLLHELGHARRRDLLVQWLFSLAVCVHWFNPLVWLAARCSRADREMACDAWVLARSRDVGPDEYGATLLKTVALLREPLCLAPHAVAMAASKRGLVMRITTIGGFRALPAWRGIAGLLTLSAVLAVISTTRLGAQAPTPESSPAGTMKKAVATSAAEPGPSPAAEQSGALPVNAPSQVELVARFVEITDSAAKKLAGINDISAAIFGGQVSGGASVAGLAGVLTSEKLEALNKVLGEEKGVDLLTTPRVTTRSGQRAVVEIINEFRYPTEWQPGDQKPPVMQPVSFETRNVGITLEVEPTLGENSRMIDLRLKPQFVELTGYNRIGPGGASTVIKVPSSMFGDRRGSDLHAKAHGVNAGPGEILQPMFSTRKVETSVVLGDGQTVVLGGLRKEGGIDEKGDPLEPSQLMIFVTAKIIDATGNASSPGTVDRR